MKTIKIKSKGGGEKEYVPVSERVKEFHRLYEDGNITVNYKRIPVGEDGTIPDAGFIFKATITLDVKENKRFFTGHSFGKIGEDKALEKAETVSIGRALGFANIGLEDGIASADEMKQFTGNQVPEKVNVADVVSIVRLCEGVSKDYINTLMQHLADKFNITQLEELTSQQATKIISDLNKLQKNENEK